MLAYFLVDYKSTKSVKYHFEHFTIQSNLYITALNIAVTLCTTVTEQLPKNHPIYLLLS